MTTSRTLNLEELDSLKISDLDFDLENGNLYK